MNETGQAMATSGAPPSPGARHLCHQALDVVNSCVSQADNIHEDLVGAADVAAAPVPTTGSNSMADVLNNIIGKLHALNVKLDRIRNETCQTG